ncbi:MAG: non-hydrolyzing UDP-N-acetylglucosamine 2-epimerase [Thermodesulfobacteriota bacterium]
MKVLVVFGTRPEAIKMAPVIKEIEKTDTIELVVCVTAQHRKMLDQVLEIFDIQPHIDLNIMTDKQDLFDVTTRILMGMRKILSHQLPDMVLVQGDTTTAFAAALSAFYNQIPVAHVEAGLRTGNIYAPFPEEANRALVGRLADLHFVPTEKSKENLLSENVAQEKIFVTGNTVIDALLMVKDKVVNRNPKIWAEQFGTALPAIMDQSKRIILVTGHRRENFGQGFLNICKALALIAKRFKDVEVIYPVHLNPGVSRPVRTILNGLPNIHLIEPLDYEPFVFLMNSSYLILTDSGGIQEEVPSLGKPVLVMRDVTERPEGVELGNVNLVGTDFNRIVSRTQRLLDDEGAYRKMTNTLNPYGDGHAAEKIVEVIKKKYLKKMIGKIDFK